MTDTEFKIILSALDDIDIAYTPYPQTRLINAEDCDGTTQSYYASTGTAIFRMSNDKYDKRRKTVRNMRIDDFIHFCTECYSDEIFKILEGRQ